MNIDLMITIAAMSTLSGLCFFSFSYIARTLMKKQKVSAKNYTRREELALMKYKRWNDPY